MKNIKNYIQKNGYISKFLILVLLISSYNNNEEIVPKKKSDKILNANLTQKKFSLSREALARFAKNGNV